MAQGLVGPLRPPTHYLMRYSTEGLESLSVQQLQLIIGAVVVGDLPKTATREELLNTLIRNSM